MVTDIALKETKKHGALRFPFNIYPCTIPKDFPEVALHWQSSMELVFIKKGSGIVQVGGRALPAQAGEVFVFTPGTLHALFQSPGIVMEYENIIFDLALLGGSAYQNNLILCGHNYTTHFGKLDLLQTGDTVCFEDAEGNEFSYQVSATDVLPGTAVEEMQAGEWDLTLFTCTWSGTSRLCIRCEAVA